MDQAAAVIDWPLPRCTAPGIIALHPHARVLMTRDMELIRRIMLAIEARTDLVPRPVQLDDVDENVLAAHMEMLFQSGMIRGGERKLSAKHYSQILVKDLSWEGHDFLAALKNDGVWKKIKSSLSPGDLASLPLGILKEVGVGLLKEVIKQQVGL